ncbi:transposase, MuDR, MULE transposase domain protein [Tanacetum coccineum]
MPHSRHSIFIIDVSLYPLFTQQIRGSPYESFEMLPYYCYNLERKNEGAITRIKTDEKGVFEMLFIALGASIRTFVNYLRPLLIIDAAHLKGQYKGTNLIAVGMDENNQIVPIAFGICKGETGPCWSWWMSVLKECIGDNPSLLFISDRHAAIALAVQNEFPLAYHAAYTTEEFSSSMSHLQDIQPDAYDKLCQLGPQRWKLPVLKLAETYRAMVQEWYYKRRKLAGLPCGHVIVVTKYLGLTGCLQFVSDWFKKPKYQGTYAEPIHFIGNVQEWEFPQHIRKAIPPGMDNPQPGRPKNTKRIKSQGLKQIKNDYDTNVMCDIAKVAGKIQLFVSHHLIDLSTVLIPNDGSLEEAFAGFINKTIPTTPYTQNNFNFVVHNNGQLVFDNTKDTTYINGGTMNINIPRMKLEELKQYWSNILEALDEEAILEEQILSLMHRFADRFTDRRVEINNLMVLHDHPLIDYGKYALGCMTGADMKKCVYLKSVRDELLRSMEETIDEELQRHVKRLLLNTSLLTIFVVVYGCFKVF